MTDLLMNMYKAFDYFAKQLPHSTDIMTEAGVNVVS